MASSSGTISDSNSFDSFGNAANSSFPVRYGFTGREKDSLTGLQFSRARFYDPSLGRFISEDPIGFGGGDINLYGYVWNNPLHFTDPMGLDGWGNDLADSLDRGINSGRGGVFDVPISFNPFTGRPITTADMGSSLADTFRLGSGVGSVIYGPYVGPLHTAEAIISDVFRAANVAGAVSAAAGAAKAAVATRAGSPIVVVGESCPTRGQYAPKTPLPQQNVGGIDIPIPLPEAQGPHTTLGTRIGHDGVPYRQSATFPGETWPKANGQNVPWRLDESWSWRSCITTPTPFFPSAWRDLETRPNDTVLGESCIYGRVTSNSGSGNKSDFWHQNFTTDV